MTEVRDLIRNLTEFYLDDVTELKWVRGRYLKFKREGRWRRVAIVNVDRYRSAAYKTFEVLATELFEDVKRIPRRVPCIVQAERGLQYITKYLFEDHETLVAHGLIPKYLKRYLDTQKLASFGIAAFYIGNRNMWYEYYSDDRSEFSEKLFYDIRWLHRIILQNKLTD